MAQPQINTYKTILAEPPDAPFTVIDDPVLGYAHRDPLPDEESVDAYYSDDTFYSEHSPNDWFQQERHEWAYNLHVYADWLSQLGGGGTLLDVGAGSGWFSKRARELGWDVVAVEPSSQARELAQAKGVYAVPTLADAGRVRDGYSAAAMILLLEHLVQPHKLLRQVRDLLAYNGTILVVVPQEFTVMQELARQKHDLPAWFVTEPHVNYFSADSLQWLTERAGFLTEDARATFPIDMMLLQGDNYIGNETLGRACYARKMAFEMAFYEAGKVESLRNLQRAWLMAGVGREIVLVARKV